MTNPQAQATYTKTGDHIFRTSTYIQWGTSERSIGSCLLLNPGSATLTNEAVRSLHASGHASGPVNTDPTMHQLISFMEKTNPKPLSGRFHIYNLFTLQNTKSEDAIHQFEALASSGLYDIQETLPSKEELSRHPWILLGWGLKQEKKWHNLKRAKQLWLDRLVEAETPSFGKQHPKTNEYYHPCPLIANRRPAMVEDLVESYQTNITLPAPRKQRYTLLKWNGETEEKAQFIVLDNKTRMQSLYIPTISESLCWFEADLAKDRAVSKWHDYGSIQLDDLDNMILHAGHLPVRK
ncbi:hypothetical protein [Halobacillus sp. KGW1]|uniref:hypothetical protein n=1 Tax=Halobacillus sp. KGW1 TaxID=1793726 RepID=UPI0007862B98|nr:hypothetical protein [Halobacillus sp. KGW1]